MRTELSGTLLILLSATLWSLIGISSKFCLTAGMPPLVCAFMRAACAALAFFLHVALTGQFRIRLRHALIFMLFGAWGIGVFFALIQYTVQLAGAAMDIVLQYTAPFWVAFFAKVFFGDRITLPMLVAIGIAAIGTVCVCFSGGSIQGELNPWGIVTGVSSGICYASQFPFIRYWQEKGFNATQLCLWMMCGASLFLIIVLGVSPISIPLDLPASVWLVAANTGVFCSYLGYFCYVQGIQRIHIIKAVITSELEPVLSIVWATLFFGECFTTIGWLGSILIVFSVLVISLSSQRR